MKPPSGMPLMFQEMTEVRPKLTREMFARLLATERAVLYIYLLAAAAAVLSTSVGDHFW